DSKRTTPRVARLWRATLGWRTLPVGAMCKAMPQSLSAVYIHVVFSTKNRRPFFQDRDLRARLHTELGAISNPLECAPIMTDGFDDHVHQLVRFGRTISQAEWIKGAEAGIEQMAEDGGRPLC